MAGVTTRTLDRWLADPDVELQPYRRAGRPRPVLISREELRTLLSVEPEKPKDDGPEEASR